MDVRTWSAIKRRDSNAFLSCWDERKQEKLLSAVKLILGACASFVGGWSQTNGREHINVLQLIHESHGNLSKHFYNFHFYRFSREHRAVRRRSSVLKGTRHLWERLDWFDATNERGPVLMDVSSPPSFPLQPPRNSTKFARFHFAAVFSAFDSIKFNLKMRNRWANGGELFSRSFN
jgi:hypothetical protein